MSCFWRRESKERESSTKVIALKYQKCGQHFRLDRGAARHCVARVTCHAKRTVMDLYPIVEVDNLGAIDLIYHTTTPLSSLSQNYIDRYICMSCHFCDRSYLLGFGENLKLFRLS